MVYSYQYSVTYDFNGTFKVFQFKDEVADNGTLPTIYSIVKNNDDVFIHFNQELTAGEITTLDTLVANHNANTNKPKIQNFTYSTITTETQSPEYHCMGRFKFGGTRLLGSLDAIEVIAHKDSSPTSYSVRIYDAKNRKVIAEKTGLTNTSTDIIDLGTVQNVPETQSVFEVHLKRVDGIGNDKKIYINQVIIYYGN